MLRLSFNHNPKSSRVLTSTQKLHPHSSVPEAFANSPVCRSFGWVHICRGESSTERFLLWCFYIRFKGLRCHRKMISRNLTMQEQRRLSPFSPASRKGKKLLEISSMEKGRNQHASQLGVGSGRVHLYFYSPPFKQHPHDFDSGKIIL